jgi:hypothetical protein
MKMKGWSFFDGLNAHVGLEATDAEDPEPTLKKKRGAQSRFRFTEKQRAGSSEQRK